MNRHLRRAVMTLGCALLATLQTGTARGGDAAPPSWNSRAAAKYLDGRAEWWLTWSGSARGHATACLSCHTSMPFALARPALGEQLGGAEAGAVEKRLLDGLKKRVENWENIVSDSPGKDPFHPYYPKNMKPRALGTEAVLNALVLVNNDARRAHGALGASTRKALTHLWEQQQADGAWLWLEFGLDPWEKDGAYYGASLAAVAIGTAGKDYYDQADLRDKVAALKKYLKTRFPNQLLHHRVAGLWASSRLPGILTEEDRQKLIEELLNAQEDDGGWSLPRLGKRAGPGAWKARGVYPEGMVSDGYATGLVVLALKRAGVAADNPKLQKGIAWLVARQQEGTWPANYLNKKRDPQNEIGMFMRDAATAFAVLALTEPTAPGPANGNGEKKTDSGKAFQDTKSLRRSVVEATSSSENSFSVNVAHTAAEAYRRLFESLGRARLPELMKDEDAGIALQAAWEYHKKVVKLPVRFATGRVGSHLVLDPASQKKFLNFLSTRVNVKVPQWWRTNLLDVEVSTGGRHCFNGPTTESAIATPFRREGKKVLISSEKRSVKVNEADIAPSGITALHGLAASLGNKRSFLAVYSDSGRSYPLFCVDSADGQLLWKAEVWAVRPVFFLSSGFHSAEIRQDESRVIVFGVECYGAYMEAFDTRTGRPLYRFCTSYWTNWSEKWVLK